MDNTDYFVWTKQDSKDLFLGSVNQIFWLTGTFFQFFEFNFSWLLLFANCKILEKYIFMKQREIFISM